MYQICQRNKPTTSVGVSQVFEVSERTGRWRVVEAAAEIAMFWDDLPSSEVGAYLGLLELARGAKYGAHTFGS